MGSSLVVKLNVVIHISD